MSETVLSNLSTVWMSSRPVSLRVWSSFPSSFPSALLAVVFALLTCYAASADVQAQAAPQRSTHSAVDLLPGLAAVRLGLLPRLRVSAGELPFDLGGHARGIV